MRKPIVVAVFLAAALCAVGLAGCGPSGSSGGQGTEAQSSPQGGAAATVQAHSDEGAPYSTQEIWVENGDKRIYGVAYVPEDAGASNRVPLVVLSHGLGNSHAAMVPCAQELAEHGYAAYVFDFCGGSTGENRSDGSNVGMSVMTEASDLEAVIDASRDWVFADSSKLVLAGESQGGMVSAVVAARHPKLARALVLFYPAFSLVHDTHERFASKKDVPETYGIFGGWMTVGRNYATDVWDYDVFKEIGAYEGPVLIEHGSEDATVDVSYARRAAKAYPHATLKVLEGAGHGFTGSYFDTAVDDMLGFLERNVGK